MTRISAYVHKTNGSALSHDKSLQIHFLCTKKHFLKDVEMCYSANCKDIFFFFFFAKSYSKQKPIIVSFIQYGPSNKSTSDW